MVGRLEYDFEVAAVADELFGMIRHSA